MPSGSSVESQQHRFYEQLPEAHAAPLWKALGSLLPSQPTGAAAPVVWRYEELRPLLLEAGEIVSAEEASRRVLMLVNPSLPAEQSAAARNLYAGLQLVLPGEAAPAHRHAAAALRVIIEGEGAFTAVDGERTHMRRGDLVLTPSWAWHDHGNLGDEPAIWLDGLDLPLINAMESNFFGGAIEGAQKELRPPDTTLRTYGEGWLQPAWTKWDKPYTPLVTHPWSRTERVLRDALEAGLGSPADGAIFRFTNPLTGGHALPSMGCTVQALAPGQRTAAHRHTSSAVYHVIGGTGQTIVDGVELAWAPHDTFALPGWAAHEHHNLGDEPAFLFAFTDEPALEALGWLAEEACEAQA